MDLHYGSGDAYGFLSHDQVCLTKDACASDFSFINVGMQQGLGVLSASGIVGLSPTNGGSKGDLFIEKMKSSGVIERSLFALKLDVKNDESSMTIGGYNMTQFAQPHSDMEFHNITKGTIHWALNLTKMTLRFDNHTDDKVFGQD